MINSKATILLFIFATMEQGNIYDAIVIGAGAAGIGAGMILSEKKANYIILEA